MTQNGSGLYRLVRASGTGPDRLATGEPLGEYEDEAAAFAALRELASSDPSPDSLYVLDPLGYGIKRGSSVAPETHQCFWFDQLASFTLFPPEVFSRTWNETDAFILSMALAYNDLKDSMWLQYYLRHGPPPTQGDKPTPYFGQWNGMGLMATRRNLAILHEILQAIRVAFDEKILPDETIQRALDRSSRQAQRDWSTLVVAACETQGQSQNELLRAYLVRIRNNIASHYYQPRQLLMGYQRHFFEMSPSIRNESAFASLGVSMAASRFYFADAAAQAAQTLQDPEEALLLDADEHLNCVNAALRQLVENYLVLKERDLPPKVRRRARQGGQQ